MDSKLEVAGVISYASDTACLQQVAVFYDKVAYGDAAEDPVKIVINAKDKSYEVTAEGQLSEVERTPNLSVTFDFEKDKVTIPIVNDRLDVQHAISGKVFSRVVELKKEQWVPERVAAH